MTTPKPNGTPNGTDILEEISSRAPPNTVLPPRGMREAIERAAGYVVRNGAAFEERLRGNSKMSFVEADDAYNPYYLWRCSEIREGRGTNISAGRKENEVSFAGREVRKGPEKPEEFAFSARMPNISAQDLEVVKLTALFVAKNGRSWMTALSQREAGNFQFDFLRPQHSLYQFFSRLVDQYTDLLNGESVDGGRPQKKRLKELEANVEDRFHVLERAKKRAEWVKYQAAQKVAKEEQEEKERVAYAQIDWHDFVVVETVVFDERDENTDLPAPMRLNDLQSSSLEQKAAMRVGADRRLEEAMPGMDDYDTFYDQAAPAPQPQQASQAQPQPTPTPPQPQQPYQPPPPTNRLTTLTDDRARARAAQEAAQQTPNQQPPKILHNYVPAAQARARSAQTTSLCPNCHQSIPNTEMEAHLRIEMLDPAWRDQNRIAQQRSSTTNLSTSDVASNLKRLASQRSDVFDPVTGEAVLGEEEVERRRRVERRAWDGVSTVPPSASVVGGVGGGAGGGGGGTGAAGQGDKGGGEKLDVQEQIRLIHERAKNG